MSRFRGGPPLLWVHRLPWTRAECEAASAKRWEPLEWRGLDPWHKSLARLSVRFELDLHDRLYNRVLPSPQRCLPLGPEPRG